ncbi:MAG: Ni/Fe hydrogenase subunit gamma [Candidatus Hydrogenedentota bacterium]|jgi:NAD(P)H-flavin reductase|uniref:Group 3b Ni,Fe-hydrogenase, subunit gamma n=1 Tax=Sumerlaea chitinivorans TaxID=2250252 RepID=A0A2Z4Y985_SUMC1|nr:Group 3b Ni,Fe-hydrogenase, subunit gamma [Candidatus Sumerlaea chitinivorans]MCX7963187.1 FAD/NAD(P)-binding protein [Candidatus Sumerlaea chitinivorans]RMH25042.1 MAG: Ni/Fe hydrogenase subunit gamma [Candidatus Hydrogenedentota bacterium]GIX44715.1 MAG: Ni/Fe hydrogenase subunit gamma [Candidatus Sumerlaea sp.]
MSEWIDPMLPRPFRVRRFIQETHDTFTLELDAVDGAKPFAFLPGQFNMLYVFGVGEVPISISGDPTSPKGLTHTTREVGLVTKAMRQLRKGDYLGVRGPFGTAWPVEEAAGNDVVIVAGGIGLAPLRPALYQLIANREKFGKIVLLYGTRSPNDILYQKELKQWRAQFDMEVYVTVDRATGDWRGNVGVVTALIPKAPFDPLSTTAFVCGPEIMMRFTVQELQKRGLTNDRIYISMERNMKCGIGLCGHCQIGPTFVCKNGPVYRFDHIEELFGKREV